MSKYIIDEKGGVSFPHPHQTSTFVVVQPEDVDRMIANGKLTKAEVQKIKTNRQNHAQQVLVQNIPPAHDEEPLATPSVAGNPAPVSDDKPLALPKMDFGEKPAASFEGQGDAAKKTSGEAPLEIKGMKF